MYRERDYFPQGINCYVPKMQMAYGVSASQATRFSLGTPAASDDDIITATLDGDATAGTETTLEYTSDSPFGRNLIMTPSADPGAALGVYDIYGFDYLGQPMRERFTGVNGSTPVQYGKKCFYRVTKAVVVTPSSNAITWDIGTGMRLGLPYKGDVSWAKEAGVFVPLYKRDFWLWTHISGAAVVGGASGAWLHCPCPGFIKTMRGSANMPIGSTNDPTITVELNTTAVTGLTFALDLSAAAVEGTAIEVDTPSISYQALNRLRPNSYIELVASDADAAVGDISLGIEITPTQFTLPDLTDPATATTGDPRGSYEPMTAPDGSTEFIVGLLGDNEVNSDDNGGLHGIQHYNG